MEIPYLFITQLQVFTAPSKRPIENICCKMEKCWYPALPPFATLFSIIDRKH